MLFHKKIMKFEIIWNYAIFEKTYKAHLSQGDVQFRFCEPHADAGSGPVAEGLHQKLLQFGFCLQSATLFVCQEEEHKGSCLKTGQHFIFVIIYQLLPIKCIIFVSVSKILFIFFLLPIIIMILIMKILLHNVYKIINLRYPTYVYPFFNFPYNTKIECWPVFKQDPTENIHNKHGHRQLSDNFYNSEN